MGLFEGRARPGGLPPEVRDAVPLSHQDRILASAVDQETGDHVIVTRHLLALVAQDGTLVWQRPWHEVDQGRWQPDTDELTVSWADGSTPGRWRLRHSTLFQQALRERIQASVVLTEEFRTDTRRRVRVAIRRNLATGAFIEQIMGSNGVDVTDSQVAEEARLLLHRLRSEIGL
jgi:hypothetical protein